MSLIFNATDHTVTTQARGNWFTFKPKQIKQMEGKLAQFLAEMRGEDGLMLLPDEFEDPDFQKTAEGKAILAKTTEEGIAKLTEKLRKVIYNLQVSLKIDLEKANIKVDPAAFASKGELEAMRMLAQYQKHGEDAQQKKIDEVKELMGKIVEPV